MDALITETFYELYSGCWSLGLEDIFGGLLAVLKGPVKGNTSVLFVYCEMSRQKRGMNQI